jgi:hypothetical protein
MDYFVYQIRARDDGRVVYIGMGKRARCYRRHRKNPDINALIDAGGTFPAEPIAGPMTQAEAHALEIELIAKCKRVCDGGTLLNVSLGGPGRSYERSPEERAKLKLSVNARFAIQRGAKPIGRRPQDIPHFPDMPHLHREFSRHGTEMLFARRGHGKRIRLRADFGTDTFKIEYAAALEDIAA